MDPTFSQGVEVEKVCFAVLLSHLLNKHRCLLDVQLALYVCAENGINDTCKHALITNKN